MWALRHEWEAAQVAVNPTTQPGAHSTPFAVQAWCEKRDRCAAILPFPDVVWCCTKAEEDEDKIWSYVQTVAAMHMNRIVAMHWWRR